MPEDDQEQQAHSGTTGPGQGAEQQQALYGPPGRGDYGKGDVIRFCSRDTGGQILTGEVLYVRAPGPAIVGGRDHPLTYITHVKGEAFPRVVYPADVVVSEEH